MWKSLVPEQHVPEQHVPEHHMPEHHVPEHHVPEHHVPEHHVPERHVVGPLGFRDILALAPLGQSCMVAISFCARWVFSLRGFFFAQVFWFFFPMCRFFSFVQVFFYAGIFSDLWRVYHDECVHGGDHGLLRTDQV